MYTLIVILHILVCALLISIILIQKGKSGGIGAIFGGGGTDQIFSTPSGSAFLRKATITITIIFFITTISLTYLSYRKSIETVTGRVAPRTAPAP
ncbi:MAG: preprotein translocase subunit SecG [Elusimicrobiota bacterium]